MISAFNFPVAVWSWNAALALVCGDPVVWKPSEKTPLTALAMQAIVERAMARFGDAPDGSVGSSDRGARHRRSVGRSIRRLPLSRATGSTAMGRAVAPRLAARFGRTILELGGNNAAIVTPIGRSRSGAARHRICRHGYGGTALHDAAATVCSWTHL